MKSGALIPSLVLLAALSLADVAVASPGHGEIKQEPSVDRTVYIIAKDIDFSPKKIVVEAGETVRFRVVNEGEMPHDFTVGTPKAQLDHRKLMAQMAAMEGHDMDSHDDGGHGHGEGSAIVVKPGQTKDLVWTFDDAKEISFACNIAGHYEAGMHGGFHVVTKHDH